MSVSRYLAKKFIVTSSQRAYNETAVSRYLVKKFIETSVQKTYGESATSRYLMKKFIQRAYKKSEVPRHITEKFAIETTKCAISGVIICTVYIPVLICLGLPGATKFAFLTSMKTCVVICLIPIGLIYATYSIIMQIGRIVMPNADIFYDHEATYEIRQSVLDGLEQRKQRIQREGYPCCVCGIGIPGVDMGERELLDHQEKCQITKKCVGCGEDFVIRHQSSSKSKCPSCYAPKYLFGNGCSSTNTSYRSNDTSYRSNDTYRAPSYEPFGSSYWQNYNNSMQDSHNICMNLNSYHRTMMQGI